MTKRKKPKRKPEAKPSFSRLVDGLVNRLEVAEARIELCLKELRNLPTSAAELRSITDRLEWMNARLSGAELGILKKVSEIERLEDLVARLRHKPKQRRR